MKTLMEAAFAFSMGLFLGHVFYIGLYQTVIHGIKAKNPGLLFAISFWLRTAMVLLGFWLVAQGDFSKLMICSGGFILSRLIVVKWTKQTPNFNLKKGKG